METQDIALAISAANFALTWGVALYMYLANKNRVTNERITTLQEDIDGKLDDHAERLSALEARVDGVPNHGNLGSLHEKINGVRADVSNLGGRMDGIEATLRQLTNLIMGKGLK